MPALPLYPVRASTEHAEAALAKEARRRSWTDEVREAVTTLADLEAHVRLTAAERLGIERAERIGLPLSITPYYLSLIDKLDPSCPIRRQVVPSIDEAHDVEAVERLIHFMERFNNNAQLLVEIKSRE